MAKARRVHEIAKALGVKPKAIVDRCEVAGIPAITNHMSSVSASLENEILKWFFENKDQLREGEVEPVRASTTPKKLIEHPLKKMAKAKRVHEIAKALGVKSKAIVDRCEAEGIPTITNHMSSVSAHLEAAILEWHAVNDLEEDTGSTSFEAAGKVDQTGALVKRKPRLSTPRQSSECTSQRTGEVLSTFLSRVLAQFEADHIRHNRDKDLVPYKCDRCDGWHLCPRDRYTPSTRCEQCNKNLYEMEEYAERRAEILGGGLRVYKCPYDDGWHLTSKV